MKFRARLLLALSITFAPAATLGAPVGLSLARAVEIALQNQYDVLSAREEISGLEGQIVEVRSEALPQLSLEASGGKSYDESTARIFGIDAEVQDFYQVKLTGQQLIYSWGKVGAAIDAARLQRERAGFDLAGVERQVKFTTHIAYYDLLLAKKLLHVAERTLEQRKLHLEVAQKRFDAGAGTKFEVIRSNAEVASARVPLIEARTRIRIAEANLNSVLAQPQETQIEPTDILEYQPFDIPELGQVIADALKNREELASLGKSRETALKAIEISEATNMPSFLAFGEYGFNSDVPGELNTNNEVWVAGLSMRFPFFDGLRTQGLVARSTSDLRLTDIALEKLRQSITLEARRALDALIEAVEVYEAAGAAVEAAERSLELAEESFKHGVATTVDVIDAEVSLSDAVTARARAMRNHMAARAGLLAVTARL